MRTFTAVPRGRRPFDASLDRRISALYVRRLLVVEDDLDLWPIFERVVRLFDSELKIDFAPDAHAAVALIVSERRYTAVLADVVLPGSRDGYSLRADCQQFQPWAGFAMMSSSPRAAAFDVRFLSKPFSIRQAREFVHDLVR